MKLLTYDWLEDTDIRTILAFDWILLFLKKELLSPLGCATLVSTWFQFFWEIIQFKTRKRKKDRASAWPLLKAHVQQHKRLWQRHFLR